MVGARLDNWLNNSGMYVTEKHTIKLKRKTSRNVERTNKDKDKYLLTQYPLPFLPTFFDFGGKPIYYIDSTNDSVFMVTGNAVVFKLNKKAITNLERKIDLQSVPSNLHTVIDDPKFYFPNWFSIKDLKIIDNTAYVSYTKKVGDAYTLSILSADITKPTLDFREFLTVPDSGTTARQFNAHEIGGRITKYKDNQLLISTGDLTKWGKSQEDTALLGKIFAIDIDTKKATIISKGHRNVQGLYYDAPTDVVISTEHGPMGGGEVNVNLNKPDSTRNFGWPIVSYGVHYDRKFHPDAPLKKYHVKNGFMPPVKQFTPSVGISEVIKLPTKFAQGHNNDYFVSSMGNHYNPVTKIMSLHYLRLNEKFEKEDYSYIYIGERIRDMLILNDDTILLALEGKGTPALAVIRNKQ